MTEPVLVISYQQIEDRNPFQYYFTEKLKKFKLQEVYERNNSLYVKVAASFTKGDTLLTKLVNNSTGESTIELLEAKHVAFNLSQITDEKASFRELGRLWLEKEDKNDFEKPITEWWKTPLLMTERPAKFIGVLNIFTDIDLQGALGTHLLQLRYPRPGCGEVGIHTPVSNIATISI